MRAGKRASELGLVATHQTAELPHVMMVTPSPSRCRGRKGCVCPKPAAYTGHVLYPAVEGLGPIQRASKAKSRQAPQPKQLHFKPRF